MKNKLIQEMIKTLENVNPNKKHILNIPWIIAPFEQHLSEDNYKELLNDLKDNDFYVSYYKDDNEYYTNGSFEIHIYKTHNALPYYYKITLGYDERWGYCECVEGDNDYDARYNCCGRGCDWDAPSFRIEKISNLGSSSFDGDEHDIWDYEDKYNNITLKDKEEQAKSIEIKKLLKEQSEIKKRLKELNYIK